jgi:hypothetical protein
MPSSIKLRARPWPLPPSCGIDCANGVIEVGHINFGPDLQRTRAGTEAIYLMMHRAFDELGFRRLEWNATALTRRRGAPPSVLGSPSRGSKEIIWKHGYQDLPFERVEEGIAKITISEPHEMSSSTPEANL